MLGLCCPIPLHTWKPHWTLTFFFFQTSRIFQELKKKRIACYIYPNLISVTLHSWGFRFPFGAISFLSEKLPLAILPEHLGWPWILFFFFWDTLFHPHYWRLFSLDIKFWLNSSFFSIHYKCCASPDQCGSMGSSCKRQKVAGLIPVRAHACLGWGFSPQLGHIWEATNVSFSLWYFSSFSLPPPHL